MPVMDGMHARRAASKAQEKQDRALANQQMAKTTQVWDQLGNNAPTQAQLNTAVQGPSFWQSLGSQAAGVGMDDSSSGGRALQGQAQQGLQQIAREGYTDADRQQMQGAMSAAQMQAQQTASAQRQATLQQAAARGQRGGGNAMMAALQANQGSNNAQALANMEMAGNVAAQGQARRLGATQALGEMGSQLRGQDLNLSQAQLGQASAVDAFNQNRSGAMDAWNQYQAQAPANAYQQAFANQAQVAQGTQNAYGNAAAFNMTQADAIRARRNQAIQMMINPMQKVGEFFASKYGGSKGSSGSSSGGSSE